jgi:hypothetical protein
MTMNVQSAETRPRARSSAERMRRHRNRRKNGLRLVEIMLRVTEIEALVRKGYLPPEERENIWALQTAVHDLLYKTLNDSA